MPYTKRSWVDGVTKLGPTNLNPIENAVAAAYTTFNVRDTAYGAVGDGVTDDTAAIQAAIDACAAAGGGIVFLPHLTFGLSAPLLIKGDKVSLRGCGGYPYVEGAATQGGSVLHALPGFTGSAVIKVARLGSASSLKGVRLSDFIIEAFNVPASTDAIYYEGAKGSIERIFAVGHTRDGVHMNDSTTIPTDNYDNLLHGIRIEGGRSGFYFENSACDNFLSHCWVYGATGNAVDCENSASGIMVDNCYLYNTTGKGVNGNISTKVVGTRIGDCNGGIYLSGDSGQFQNFQIEHNMFNNCSKATDNTTDSINITSSAAQRGGIISGNEFYTNAGLFNGGTGANHNRPRYHINIASANVSDVSVGVNGFGHDTATTQRSFGTAFINNDGTRTKIAPIVLAQSAVAIPHTGDTGFPTVATIKVPGGLMGKNGRLRITSLWSMTNNANSKSWFVNFGGTSFYSLSAGSIATVQAVTHVANRGAQNSQVGAPSDMTSFGSGTSALVTTAIDTSADQDVTLALHVANAADTITLESYSIEVQPG